MLLSPNGKQVSLDDDVGRQSLGRSSGTEYVAQNGINRAQNAYDACEWMHEWLHDGGTHDMLFMVSSSYDSLKKILIFTEL